MIKIECLVSLKFVIGLQAEVQGGNVSFPCKTTKDYGGLSRCVCRINLCVSRRANT